MRAPGFWFTPGWSLGRVLLWPLSLLYGAAHRLDWELKSLRQQRAALPVICIGNLTIGGTGKTPVTQWLGQSLQMAGLNPVVISRGYGGRETGPLLVDASQHDAALVGDEPLMLATHLPVIVARDRAAGAALAHRMGFDCVLLDDGFQNPGLHKDFSLLVADSEIGFGNGSLLPAGPLREPVTRGLARAQAVMATGSGQAMPDFAAPPVWRASLDTLPGDLDPALSWFAFCGIGRPQKFYDSLRQHGFNMVGQQDFSDHHDYSTDDLGALLSMAREKGYSLITTEKDAVKFPPALRRSINVLPLSITVTDGQLLLDQILTTIKARQE